MIRSNNYLKLNAALIISNIADKTQWILILKAQIFLLYCNWQILKPHDHFASLLMKCSFEEDRTLAMRAI
jgi:hypothetical protein